MLFPRVNRLLIPRVQIRVLIIRDTRGESTVSTGTKFALIVITRVYCLYQCICLVYLIVQELNIGLAGEKIEVTRGESIETQKRRQSGKKQTMALAIFRVAPTLPKRGLAMGVKFRTETGKRLPGWFGNVSKRLRDPGSNGWKIDSSPSALYMENRPLPEKNTICPEKKGPK